MRNYELTVILNPEIAEEEVPQAMDNLTALISKNGGEIDATDHWGRRRLSYPIKHHAEGNYVLFKMRIEPDNIRELESELNIMPASLRHLLVQAEA